MPRNSFLGTKPRKARNWLGHLLGCLSLKATSCGSSGSDIDLPAGHDMALDNDGSTPVVAKVAKNRYSLKLLSKTSAFRKQQPQQLRDHEPVLLLSVRPAMEDDSVSASTATTGTSRMTSSLPVFSGSRYGPLELALLFEGLLEYKDPQASIPVLTLCYGFSDEELRALSRRKLSGQKSEDFWYDKWGCCEQFLGAASSLEPLIDGLPPAVWLECVEPTLSILISLNALRHRRSNLSIKKGLPDTFDSNRSRHGDFEFGPIAVFHHQPDRLQQMMLLRVEFLNAAANPHLHPHNLPNVANSYSDLNQSAMLNGRQRYNRHRRLRYQGNDEIIENDNTLNSRSVSVMNNLNYENTHRIVNHTFNNINNILSMNNVNHNNSVSASIGYDLRVCHVPPVGSLSSVLYEEIHTVEIEVTELPALIYPRQDHFAETLYLSEKYWGAGDPGLNLKQPAQPPCCSQAAPLPSESGPQRCHSTKAFQASTLSQRPLPRPSKPAGWQKNQKDAEPSNTFQAFGFSWSFPFFRWQPSTIFQGFWTRPNDGGRKGKEICKSHDFAASRKSSQPALNFLNWNCNAIAGLDPDGDTVKVSSSIMADEVLQPDSLNSSCYNELNLKQSLSEKVYTVFNWGWLSSDAANQASNESDSENECEEGPKNMIKVYSTLPNFTSLNYNCNARPTSGAAAQAVEENGNIEESAIGALVAATSGVIMCQFNPGSGIATVSADVAPEAGDQPEAASNKPLSPVPPGIKLSQGAGFSKAEEELECLKGDQLVSDGNFPAAASECVRNLQLEVTSGPMACTATQGDACSGMANNTTYVLYDSAKMELSEKSSVQSEIQRTGKSYTDFLKESAAVEVAMEAAELDEKQIEAFSDCSLQLPKTAKTTDSLYSHEVVFGTRVTYPSDEPILEISSQCKASQNAVSLLEEELLEAMKNLDDLEHKTEISDLRSYEYRNIKKELGMSVTAHIENKVPDMFHAQGSDENVEHGFHSNTTSESGSHESVIERIHFSANCEKTIAETVMEHTDMTKKESEISHCPEKEEISNPRDLIPTDDPASAEYTITNECLRTSEAIYTVANTQDMCPDEKLKDLVITASFELVEESVIKPISDSKISNQMLSGTDNYLEKSERSSLDSCYLNTGGENFKETEKFVASIDAEGSVCDFNAVQDSVIPLDKTDLETTEAIDPYQTADNKIVSDTDEYEPANTDQEDSYLCLQTVSSDDGYLTATESVQNVDESVSATKSLDQISDTGINVDQIKDTGINLDQINDTGINVDQINDTGINVDPINDTEINNDLLTSENDQSSFGAAYDASLAICEKDRDEPTLPQDKVTTRQASFFDNYCSEVNSKSQVPSYAKVFGPDDMADNLPVTFSHVFGITEAMIPFGEFAKTENEFAQNEIARLTEVVNVSANIESAGYTTNADLESVTENVVDIKADGLDSIVKMTTHAKEKFSTHQNEEKNEATTNIDVTLKRNEFDEGKDVLCSNGKYPDTETVCSSCVNKDACVLDQYVTGLQEYTVNASLAAGMENQCELLNDCNAALNIQDQNTEKHTGDSRSNIVADIKSCLEDILKQTIDISALVSITVNKSEAGKPPADAEHKVNDQSDHETDCSSSKSSIASVMKFLVDTTVECLDTNSQPEEIYVINCVAECCTESNMAVGLDSENLICSADCKLSHVKPNDGEGNETDMLEIHESKEVDLKGDTDDSRPGSELKHGSEKFTGALIKSCPDSSSETRDFTETSDIWRERVAKRDNKIDDTVSDEIRNNKYEIGKSQIFHTSSSSEFRLKESISFEQEFLSDHCINNHESLRQVHLECCMAETGGKKEKEEIEDSIDNWPGDASLGNFLLREKQETTSECKSSSVENISASHEAVQEIISEIITAVSENDYAEPEFPPKNVLTFFVHDWIVNDRLETSSDGFIIKDVKDEDQNEEESYARQAIETVKENNQMDVIVDPEALVGLTKYQVCEQTVKLTYQVDDHKKFANVLEDTQHQETICTEQNEEPNEQIDKLEQDEDISISDSYSSEDSLNRHKGDLCPDCNSKSNVDKSDSVSAQQLDEIEKVDKISCSGVSLELETEDLTEQKLCSDAMPLCSDVMPLCSDAMPLCSDAMPVDLEQHATVDQSSKTALSFENSLSVTKQLDENEIFLSLEEMGQHENSEGEPIESQDCDKDVHKSEHDNMEVQMLSDGVIENIADKETLSENGQQIQRDMHVEKMSYHAEWKSQEQISVKDSGFDSLLEDSSNDAERSKMKIFQEVEKVTFSANFPHAEIDQINVQIKADSLNNIDHRSVISTKCTGIEKEKEDDSDVEREKQSDQTSLAYVEENIYQLKMQCHSEDLTPSEEMLMSNVKTNTPDKIVDNPHACTTQQVAEHSSTEKLTFSADYTQVEETIPTCKEKRNIFQKENHPKQKQNLLTNSTYSEGTQESMNTENESFPKKDTLEICKLSDSYGVSSDESSVSLFDYKTEVQCRELSKHVETVSFSANFPDSTQDNAQIMFQSEDHIQCEQMAMSLSEHDDNDIQLKQNQQREKLGGLKSMVKDSDNLDKSVSSPTDSLIDSGQAAIIANAHEISFYESISSDKEVILLRKSDKICSESVRNEAGQSQVRAACELITPVKVLQYEMKFQKEVVSAKLLRQFEFEDKIWIFEQTEKDKEKPSSDKEVKQTKREESVSLKVAEELKQTKIDDQESIMAVEELKYETLEDQEELLTAAEIKPISMEDHEQPFVAKELQQILLEDQEKINQALNQRAAVNQENSMSAEELQQMEDQETPTASKVAKQMEIETQGNLMSAEECQQKTAGDQNSLMVTDELKPIKTEEEGILMAAEEMKQVTVDDQEKITNEEESNQIIEDPENPIGVGDLKQTPMEGYEKFVGVDLKSFPDEEHEKAISHQHLGGVTKEEQENLMVHESKQSGIEDLEKPMVSEELKSFTVIDKLMSDEEFKLLMTEDQEKHVVAEDEQQIKMEDQLKYLVIEELKSLTANKNKRPIVQEELKDITIDEEEKIIGAGELKQIMMEDQQICMTSEDLKQYSVEDQGIPMASIELETAIMDHQEEFMASEELKSIPIIDPEEFNKITMKGQNSLLAAQDVKQTAMEEQDNFCVSEQLEQVIERNQDQLEQVTEGKQEQLEHVTEVSEQLEQVTEGKQEQLEHVTEVSEQLEQVTEEKQEQLEHVKKVSEQLEHVTDGKLEQLEQETEVSEQLEHVTERKQEQLEQVTDEKEEQLEEVTEVSEQLEQVTDGKQEQVEQVREKKQEQLEQVAERKQKVMVVQDFKQITSDDYCNEQPIVAGELEWIAMEEQEKLMAAEELKQTDKKDPKKFMEDKELKLNVMEVLERAFTAEKWNCETNTQEEAIFADASRTSQIEVQEIPLNEYASPTDSRTENRLPEQNEVSHETQGYEVLVQSESVRCLCAEEDIKECSNIIDKLPCDEKTLGLKQMENECLEKPNAESDAVTDTGETSIDLMFEENSSEETTYFDVQEYTSGLDHTDISKELKKNFVKLNEESLKSEDIGQLKVSVEKVKINYVNSEMDEKNIGGKLKDLSSSKTNESFNIDHGTESPLVQDEQFEAAFDEDGKINVSNAMEKQNESGILDVLSLVKTDHSSVADQAPETLLDEDELFEDAVEVLEQDKDDSNLIGDIQNKTYLTNDSSLKKAEGGSDVLWTLMTIHTAEDDKAEKERAKSKTLTAADTTLQAIDSSLAHTEEEEEKIDSDNKDSKAEEELPEIIKTEKHNYANTDQTNDEITSSFSRADMCTCTQAKSVDAGIATTVFCQQNKTATTQIVHHCPDGSQWSIKTKKLSEQTLTVTETQELNPVLVDHQDEASLKGLLVTTSLQDKVKQQLEEVGLSEALGITAVQHTEASDVQAHTGDVNSSLYKSAEKLQATSSVLPAETFSERNRQKAFGGLETELENYVNHENFAAVDEGDGLVSTAINKSEKSTASSEVLDERNESEEGENEASAIGSLNSLELEALRELTSQTTFNETPPLDEDADIDPSLQNATPPLVSEANKDTSLESATADQVKSSTVSERVPRAFFPTISSPPPTSSTSCLPSELQAAVATASTSPDPQRVDVKALGDHTMWSIVPEQGYCIRLPVAQRVATTSSNFTPTTPKGPAPGVSSLNFTPTTLIGPAPGVSSLNFTPATLQEPTTGSSSLKTTLAKGPNPGISSFKSTPSTVKGPPTPGVFSRNFIPAPTNIQTPGVSSLNFPSATTSTPTPDGQRRRRKSSLARLKSARKTLWDYSRSLVKRARGAWSRWATRRPPGTEAQSPGDHRNGSDLRHSGLQSPDRITRATSTKRSTRRQS